MCLRNLTVVSFVSVTVHFKTINMEPGLLQLLHVSGNFPGVDEGSLFFVIVRIATEWTNDVAPEANDMFFSY